MAMDHQSSTFSFFSSLPTELRDMVFEEALLPLTEPRIVVVKKGIDEDDGFYSEAYADHSFAFFVINESVLRTSDPFVTSATTLSRVCKESRRVVLSFCRRFGEPCPQPAFASRGLNELCRSTPLRPRGPYADIFFWDAFSILQDHGLSSWLCSCPADSDLGNAKRWLVPLPRLLEDFDRMMNGGRSFSYNTPLLESPHDIIALVMRPGDEITSLEYSDLIIVTADDSRQMLIPGLDTGDRDLITKRFESLKHGFVKKTDFIKKAFARLQRTRLEQGRELIVGQPPDQLFPDLYFAYVNPLKRSEPLQLINE